MCADGRQALGHAGAVTETYLRSAGGLRVAKRSGILRALLGALPI